MVSFTLVSDKAWKLTCHRLLGTGEWMRAILIVPQAVSLAGVAVSITDSGKAEAVYSYVRENTEQQRFSPLLIQTDLKDSTRVYTHLEQVCIALWRDLIWQSSICVEGKFVPANVPVCVWYLSQQPCGLNIALFCSSCLWCCWAIDQLLCILRSASTQVTNALPKNISKCFQYRVSIGIESSMQNLGLSCFALSEQSLSLKRWWSNNLGNN